MSLVKYSIDVRTLGWGNRVSRYRGIYVPGQKGFSDRKNGQRFDRNSREAW